MRSSKAATPIRSTISACIPRATRRWCARSCPKPRTSRRSASTAKRRSCRGFTMPACSPARCRTAPGATSCAPGSATPWSNSRIPTAFRPILTDFDLYLLGEGTHQRLYDKLGAHPMTLDGVDGVGFVVLAPNARRVSVVGDFNFWDRAAASDARARRRLLGAVRARTPRPATTTSSTSSARRASICR